MKPSTVLTALIGTAYATVASAGSIQVINNCGFDISCARVRGAGPTNPAPDTTTQDSFNRISPGTIMVPVDIEDDLGDTIQCGNADQIAAQFSANQNPTVMQVEYMWNTIEQHLYWDASLINGDPFHAQGFHVQNTNVGFSGTNPPPGEWSTCWDSTCAPLPPDQDCPHPEQVYHVSDENKAIRTCPGSDFLIWTICSG